MVAKTFLVAAAAMAMWGGCIPVYATVRQPHSGQVLDGESGLPIANAVVRVESYLVHNPPIPPGRGWLKRSLEVTTDAAGRWSVPREREWRMGILVPDGMPLYADVYCVFADGYPGEIRNAYRDWLGLSSKDEYATRDSNKMPRVLLLFRGWSATVYPALSSSTRPTSRCGVPQWQR